MEKDFLEVFLGLEVEKELKALLEDVKVTKIAVNPKKDRMRVYIQSIQWIQKKYIYALEKQIKKQFFASAQIQIKIIEKFTLTSQYTPKLFFEAYRSSMLDELRGHSILIYNTFRTAKIEFPEENKMKLVMQSSVLAKSHEEELISYIEKIFCERCAFSLIVEPEYEEAGESKIRKNSEIRIMQEAAHVIEQSSFGHVKDEAEAGTEDLKGRILVANVIMNRVKYPEFPDNATDVIWQYIDGVAQFSPIADGRISEVVPSDETKEAVKQALEGVDYSDGALFFIQRSAAAKNNIQWFDKNLKKLFKHGVHEFYTYPEAAQQ